MFPVGLMCEVQGASKSGFYGHFSPKRQESEGRKYLLLRTIEKLFQGSKGTYGSPRILVQLRAMGFRVSKKTVEKMMRENAIFAKKKRKYRATTDSRHTLAVSANILSRKFDQGVTGKVWLSDITYLWTDEGWAYLAAIMDGHSRKIVGWELSNSLEKEGVIRAMNMALGRERIAPGTIFHSDRGAQYASHDFRKILGAHGFIQSMSRRGNCWDNAAMESFFDTIKSEHIHHQKFATRKEARASIFQWIEVFYNRVRLHSKLGYKSPACFEEESLANAA